MKAKFIRSIGGCLVNNFGFDLYENQDGSATIRPVKCYRNLPNKHFIKFESVEDAEEAIDTICGDECFGAERVEKLKEVWL